MANIANRSPWTVKAPGQQEKKFRLKSQAEKYVAEHDIARAKVQQLATAFEVQIKLKDSQGNIVTRSATHDTYDQAKAWADEEEAKILSFKKANGSFDETYENLTLAAALRKFHAEHYKGKSSSKENGYRVEHIIDWLDGEKRLFKDLTKKNMLSFRTHLQNVPYSKSSVKNYFTVLNSLFKHAISEWQYPIANPVNGIYLPEPKNAIERYWQGDEKERLYASMRKNRPWLEDIVDMSLEMSFRRGEIVAGAKDKTTGKQEPGMLWEGVNFTTRMIRLFKEKNDWTKSNSELKGRTVPMSDKMLEILLRHYEKHPTKKGPVFLTYRLNGEHTPTTVNTVSHAFTEVCRLAEPPIEGLTFHSCRKIATVDLAPKVPNAIYLSRITGHKSINVLAARYFAVPDEEMKRMLNIGQTGNIVERGISMLERHFNKEQVAEFLREVRRLGDVKAEVDVIEETEQAPALATQEEDVADTISQTWAKQT